MCNDIRTHLDKIEQDITKLSSRSAFVFALLCLERQWLVYERATNRKPWFSRKAYLRKSLDRAWESITTNIPIPEGFSEYSKNGVLNYDEYPDFVSDEHVSAFYISNGIFEFTASLERGESTYSSRVAAQSIDYIEHLQDIYDEAYGPSNRRPALLQAQMDRQDDDMDLLLKEKLTPALIDKLRKSAKKESIYGNCWFPARA